MLRNVQVEAEHNELILENSFGDKVIIPANKRKWVQEKLKSNCNDCIDNLVNSLPSMADYAEDGAVYSNMKVHELYTAKTGKEWSTAKQEGLTTGSYKDNMALRDRLLAGELDNPNRPAPIPIKDRNISDAKSFNEAFKIARNQLGANQIFEFKGRKYGTNLKGEQFNPSDEILTKFGINTPEVKENLAKQNKMVGSVYSTKQTVKLEPDPVPKQQPKTETKTEEFFTGPMVNEFVGPMPSSVMMNNDSYRINYDEYNLTPEQKQTLREQEERNIQNVDRINQFNQGKGNRYLILDKTLGKLHFYENGVEVASYNVGVGKRYGDDETHTVVRDGKVIWNEGNYMTGAGAYTASFLDPTKSNFEDSPFWNFTNNEHGNIVPTAIHAAPGENRKEKLRDDDPFNNKMSAGCINGLCEDLSDLYKRGFTVGDQMYVLPESDSGEFVVQDDQLVFNRLNQ